MSVTQVNKKKDEKYKSTASRKSTSYVQAFSSMPDGICHRRRFITDSRAASTYDHFPRELTEVYNIVKV